MMLGRRGVGVYWEGVWPAGCNNIENYGDRGAVEGLEYFDEDRMVLECRDEGGPCGSIGGVEEGRE